MRIQQSVNAMAEAYISTILRRVSLIVYT